ncbi:hypothetical protein [Micropruina sp.]|uniref:hypothetical protein n=1 Tax=Micropruina sp. TaxID=2737536 RepID=UPI0039E63F79
MNDAIRDVAVTGYEPLIDKLELPDPDDRHVVAAAIHAGAQVIVTRNLRDFPSDALGPWGIEAQHPDAFLAGLHEAHPDTLGRITTGIARAWGRNTVASDVLDRLAVDTPHTADLIRQTLGNPTA